MRQTSLESYRHIVGAGILGKQQKKVFQAIRSHGPITGRELDDLTGSMDAHKRVSELNGKGLIREHDRRRCKISGRNAIAWVAD